ncbi:MAG: hypothetical protein QMD85_03995, partial [Candidatus Aenigmarchaeota archaeon]|nr:hypothetical protein [Candidatus Aenigmarchaeota archaeon]
DTNLVESAKSALTFDAIRRDNANEDNITNDLYLPTSINGTTIRWSSSREDVITRRGTVLRSIDDVQVILTALIAKGSAGDVKEFLLTVKGAAGQDETDVNRAKSALMDSIVLNGNPSFSEIIADLYFPRSLFGTAISWSSTNSSIISPSNGSVVRQRNEDKAVNVTAVLSKGTANSTKVFVFIIRKRAAPKLPVNNSIEIEDGETEIVIDSTNSNATAIVIPLSINESQTIHVNLAGLRDTTGNLTITSVLSLSRETSAARYIAEISAGTVITGPVNWNGIINLPTVRPNSEVSVSKGTVERVIEIGFAEGQLNLTKAVKIVLSGMAGKKAGYSRNNTFFEIAECTSPQIADPDSISDGSDCHMSSGSDLIIWTKHFTQFVAYSEPGTPSPPPATPSGGNGGSGGGGGCTPDYRLSSPESLDTEAGSIITVTVVLAATGTCGTSPVTINTEVPAGWSVASARTGYIFPKTSYNISIKIAIHQNATTGIVIFRASAGGKNLSSSTMINIPLSKKQEQIQPEQNVSEMINQSIPTVPTIEAPTAGVPLTGQIIADDRRPATAIIDAVIIAAIIIAFLIAGYMLLHDRQQKIEQKVS